MKQRELCVTDSRSKTNRNNDNKKRYTNIRKNEIQYTVTNCLRNLNIENDKPKSNCMKLPQMSSNRSQRCLEHKIVQSNFDYASNNFKFTFHRINLFAGILLFGMCLAVVNGQHQVNRLNSQNTGESYVWFASDHSDYSESWMYLFIHLFHELSLSSRVALWFVKLCGVSNLNAIT